MADKEFAKRLKTLCSGADIEWTQAGVAKLFGTSKAAASYYMNGLKLPTLNRAIAVSARLNCCVEYLLTGRGPLRPTIDDLADHDGWVRIDDLTERQQRITRDGIAEFRDKRPSRNKPPKSA